MASPSIKVGVVANVFTRQMHFASAGDTLTGHTHSYDHMSLLASGAVSVDIDGQVTEFSAPHMIFVRAGKQHTFTATSDNTVVYCVHGLRGDAKSDDLIDPDMVPKGPALKSFLLDQGVAT